MIPLSLAATALALGRRPVHGQLRAAGQVAIGYQPIYSPMMLVIAQGRIEEATGRAVKWVEFDSGVRVLQALQAGEIEIGLAGSSPIAAAVSDGAEISLFWIVQQAGATEALVVRDGAGIDPRVPQTLRGHKLGVTFGSTSHFLMQRALAHWDVPSSGVTLVDLKPSQIVAAWARGDIDGAFVWEPALGRIRATGEVMLTSDGLAARGDTIFDGLVVARPFAHANRAFMDDLVRVMAATTDLYLDDPIAWTPESTPVQALVGVVGGDAEDVPGALSQLRFPSLAEQASPRWLGGGGEGGAATALARNARYLADQGRIPDLAPDYGAFVDPSYVEAALEVRR